MEQDPNNPSSGPGATPAPGSPATGTPASVGATPSVKPPTTLEEAMARIADLERHSANKEEQATRHGTKLTEVEKELAAYKEKERKTQDATLSEQQKLAKRAEEAEQKYQQTQKQLVTAHIKLAAKEKGARNPDVVASHIASQLEYDKDTGLPTNLEKVLEDLSKSDSYLFATAEPASPAQQRPPQILPNNPGRSAIAPPGQQQLPRNQWPKLGDILK